MCRRVVLSSAHCDCVRGNSHPLSLLGELTAVARKFRSLFVRHLHASQLQLILQFSFSTSLQTFKMNTYFAVAAAALAFVASVNGEACSATQQASAYTSMVGLLQGTALNTCASESGYNMLYATSLPTAEQTAAMCKVDACHELIKNVQATNPPDCDLNIPTSGAVMNVKSLADNFEPGCSSSTTTEAPATPATEAPATPTATDAPTTPTATTATPEQDNKDTKQESTPAATTTTTAPIAC